MAHDPNRPFRIAILGDFSGRLRRREQRGDLASRPPIRVDRDSVDDAIARLQPAVRLALSPGAAPLDIRFRALDDFHPDSLYERVALFRDLLAARTSPRTAFAAPPSTPSPGDGLLDAMLGDVPLPPGGAALATPAPPTGDPALHEYVRQAVLPHVVEEATPSEHELDMLVTDVIESAMRVVLHHPQFQAVEALWRGVDFLSRRLDTDERLQLHLIDVSAEELVSDLATNEPAQSRLHRLLVDASVGAPGAPRWSLFLAAYTFGDRPNDLAVLGGLGGVARAAGVPLLAAADPSLAGAPSVGALADPDEWNESSSEPWNRVRHSNVARHIALFAPRFLLRLPYGERTDSCERFRFEEMSPDDSAPPESYLWGNGAFVGALLLGDAFGSSELARPAREVSHLPLHIYRRDGEAVATPCAEVLLTERAVEQLLERGLTPLVSVKDDDRVIVPRLQSIAEPLSSLAGV